MYASIMRAPHALPAKFGYFLAAWAYLCTHFDEPLPGTREIALEEWGATPPEYLVHPAMHPKMLGRITGDSTVENKREQLFKKAGHKEHDPSTPHGH